MPQDDFQQARERYDDAREAMRENRFRMEEDLEFSNPADPQQWQKETLADRTGRPTLTLDNTNQFIQQVVNDGRQNSPSIQVVPVDSKADVLVAQQLNGRLRHIEYASRAGTAYDTALEYSARIGLGWLRVVPVVMDGEKNLQEPRIFSVNDPLSCCIDGDSVELDGRDAMYGFAETILSKRAFERQFPKAKAMSFGSAQDWCTERDGIRVAEYFKVIEKQVNHIELEDPDSGNSYTVTEDEYHDTAKKTGVKPAPISTFMAAERSVKWYKMSGVEFLEETDFPSQWIGLVPVYGHVITVRGKRYICGLTRRLMNGQRFHNYQMTSLAETMLAQPKAPFIAPGRAIEGYEDHWQKLNSGNPSYLPYNDIDDDGNEVGAPQRLAGPQFPIGFANGANLGLNEMQASVGMYKSNLGQQSNAVSGRAKLADKSEGDTATFNFHDNRRISLEQLGRILVDMERRLNDTPRRVRTLGLENNKVSFIQVDPDMDTPTKKDANGKVTAINPSIGEYDCRVKIGPSHATQREELNERLTQLGQGNPQLAAALAPLMVKMADMPDADRVARICLALLPPPVQAAYDDDEEGAEIPPQVKQKVLSMQQQLQQATQLIQQLSQELNQANDEDAQKAAQDAADAANKSKELDIKWYEAKTARISADAAAAKVGSEPAMQQITEIVSQHDEVLGQIHQALMHTQGQIAALTDAHAGLHDQVMPPDQPLPPIDASQVPQPAAEGQPS